MILLNIKSSIIDRWNFNWPFTKYMKMRNKYLFICLALFFSCTPIKKQEETVDMITWENASKNDDSFLESIDIIPLETDSNILVKTPEFFQYIKEINAFLLMDSRKIIYLFNEDGKHQSNSYSCIGEGPQEYIMAADATYNPYSNTIDIYNVHNKTIHCYDLQFNWKRTIKLNNKNRFAAQIISVLGKDCYALDPVRLNEQDLFMRIYNLDANGKIVTTDVPYNKDGYIAEINMMRKNLLVTDSCIYYTPHYMDYYFYLYDAENKTFRKIYKLDFGNDNITKKMLDKLYGVSNSSVTEKEVLRNISIMQEKSDYLLSSEFPLPIIRLINDSYVYVHFIRNRKPYHLIHNRKDKKTFGLSPNSKLNMYRCFSLVDNELYTIIYPYELDRYITEENKRFFSKEALLRLGKITDEDNPVVIKYILKK